MEFYISPDGDDSWSGTLAEPNAQKSDGPFASLEGARKGLQDWRHPSGTRESWKAGLGAKKWPVTVWVRGGYYPMVRAVKFSGEDSYPVHIRAWPGETPVFDGGVEVTGWEIERRGDLIVWRAPWNDSWDPRQLWVNGDRAKRSRWPKEGTYDIVDPLNGGKNGWLEPGTSRFVVDRSHWEPLLSEPLGALDVVALHFWVEERLPVETYDPESGTVNCARTSISPLNEAGRHSGARYFLENAIATLSEPGEWACDPMAGLVWYVPRPGETPETSAVCAAVTPQLLAIEGDAETGKAVEFLHFEGLTFAHTAAILPGDPEWPEAAAHFGEIYYRGENGGAAHQAAADVPGVISFRHARNCTLTRCAVRGAGWYAVEIGPGCRSLTLDQNQFQDLGAGGIHVTGDRDISASASGLRLTNNHIHNYGAIFFSAVGILIRNAGGNLIAHNHVHHGLYTGISVGWKWDFSLSLAIDNIVEWNHIHDIGQGILSDMGGIYLLGSAGGTQVLCNLIHDIKCAHYGGWAIYPDQASSHLLIENNLCYRSSSSVFHQHWGRENIVRNNVFAFGGEAVIALCKTTPYKAATFTRNLLIASGTPIYSGGYGLDVADGKAFESDLNLIWDISDSTGSPVIVAANPREHEWTGLMAWEAWLKTGRDRHSVRADPLLTAPLVNKVQLSADSPALALGFVPFDLSDAGVGPDSGESQE